MFADDAEAIEASRTATVNASGTPFISSQRVGHASARSAPLALQRASDSSARARQRGPWQSAQSRSSIMDSEPPTQTPALRRGRARGPQRRQSLGS